MNDAQSTIVGLKAQDCPGGGWTGQPESIEQATVADCLAHGVCGCCYGDAVQHIERLRAALTDIANGNIPEGMDWVDVAHRALDQQRGTEK